MLKREAPCPSSSGGMCWRIPYNYSSRVTFQLVVRFSFTSQQSADRLQDGEVSLLCWQTTKGETRPANEKYLHLSFSLVMKWNTTAFLWGRLFVCHRHTSVSYSVRVQLLIGWQSEFTSKEASFSTILHPHLAQSPFFCCTSKSTPTADGIIISSELWSEIWGKIAPHYKYFRRQTGCNDGRNASEVWDMNQPRVSDEEGEGSATLMTFIQF